MLNVFVYKKECTEKMQLLFNWTVPNLPVEYRMLLTWVLITSRMQESNIKSNRSILLQIFFLKSHSHLPFKCLDFLGVYKKRLDKKDKVNFQIYDVTACITKKYNTHIAEYLTN